MNEKFHGGGKIIVIEPETKKSLCTQIYNSNRIMKGGIEYFFKNKNINKMAIDYNGINMALNGNEINSFENFKKYIKIYDENNKLLTNNLINPDLIKLCAKYQIQTRLKDSTDKLDDENRMEGSSGGLESIIILSELIDDIKTLKKIRFELNINKFNC